MCEGDQVKWFAVEMGRVAIGMQYSQVEIVPYAPTQFEEILLHPPDARGKFKG